jgi:arsenite/tail-anchored protein-transporting ATPase
VEGPAFASLGPLSSPPSHTELVLARVLLFTGKGGVGKTSVAAATAASIAARGGRVLVTSTDPAHSLADALDAALGDRPVSITPPEGAPAGAVLDAQQIDAQQRLEHHWRDVRDYLVSLLSWGGVGAVEAEELVLLPGLDELFALIDLRTHLRSGRYDVIVVDCAPTAETLKLLSLPDALRWYTDRVFGPGRRVARAMMPLTRGLGPSGEPLPLPDDGVLDQVERVHAQLAEVHRLLRDPTRSSVRLVLNPERMAIAETRRTATAVALFGYAIDAVIVNRVLPDEVVDPYLERWKRRHAEHLATIRSSFEPMPVLTAPLFGDELVGLDGLSRLGAALYGDRDAGSLLHAAPPLRLELGEHEHRLELALPFTAGDDLELHQRDDELHLKVAGVKRTVPLPTALRGCEVSGARLDDGWLRLRFRPAEARVGRP